MSASKIIENAAAVIFEHEGVKLTQSERRELGRFILDGEARRQKFRQAMRSPDYAWKKPAPRR